MDEHQFNLFRQEVDNRLERLQDRVEHIAQTLDSIGKLREDVARVLLQHEARTAEMGTMWRKLDDCKDIVDELTRYNQKHDHRLQAFPEVKDAVTEWKHQLGLIVKIISAFGAVAGAGAIWVYQQLTEVRELDRRMNMVERVHQLDPASKRDVERMNGKP